MKTSMRSDYCGNLRIADVGREVSVTGWVQRRRDLGAALRRGSARGILPRTSGGHGDVFIMISKFCPPETVCAKGAQTAEPQFFRFFSPNLHIAFLEN